MFRRFFHVNVCVRDMERSIRFYEDLGFKKAQDFILGGGKPNIGEALGVEVKKLRGVFMRLGDDPHAPVLDLVQFLDPPPAPRRSLSDVQPYWYLPDRLCHRLYRQGLRHAERQRGRICCAATALRRAQGKQDRNHVLQGPGRLDPRGDESGNHRHDQFALPPVPSPTPMAK
jgi:catechol 2,3-dioxygenase-like lactoylglutathione lyase family enzyme